MLLPFFFFFLAAAVLAGARRSAGDAFSIPMVTDRVTIEYSCGGKGGEAMVATSERKSGGCWLVVGIVDGGDKCPCQCPGGLELGGGGWRSKRSHWRALMSARPPLAAL